jgi:hypothetical protein
MGSIIIYIRQHTLSLLGLPRLLLLRCVLEFLNLFIRDLVQFALVQQLPGIDDALLGAGDLVVLHPSLVLGWQLV